MNQPLDSSGSVLRLFSAEYHEYFNMSSHADTDRFTWDLRQEDMDLDDLSRQLQDAREQQGEQFHAYSHLAYVRYLQGRPEEAESILSQSEEKIRECYGEKSDLRLIVMYGDLAWLKYHRGDYTQSQNYYKRVQDVLFQHPTGSPAVLHPEVYGEKAWTFLKFSVSYHHKAIDCFCRALELQPDASEWNKGYTIALYRTEPRNAETTPGAEDSPATKQLSRALDLDPDDGFLLALLALKLAAHHKHQEAKSLVERALLLSPDDPQVICHVGRYLRQQGQLDRSIDLLQRVLRRSSRSHFIHHQLALCYRKKKLNLFTRRQSTVAQREIREWRRLCIQHLEEAVTIKPTFLFALAELPQQYMEEGDVVRAQKLILQSLDLLSNRDERIRQFVHLRSGQFYLHHNNQEHEAITHFTQGLLITTRTMEGRQCAQNLRKIAEQCLVRDRSDIKAHGLLGLVNRCEGEERTAGQF
ncbi:interferon-induced protein with tetratricopeptide repeats 5-like [Anabas testudineus]|uniref:interferon-induced protein with tetratricopeptide repeats 5-like n=1 Tax=Anabas testudineus TaxID=64144 RepID=UPI000E45C861|nr:interferon-induced protein with tetratricopeptide repeats 5-like [Anabas testudineus]